MCRSLELFFFLVFVGSERASSKPRKLASVRNRSCSRRESKFNTMSSRRRSGPAAAPLLLLVLLLVLILRDVVLFTSAKPGDDDEGAPSLDGGDGTEEALHSSPSIDDPIAPNAVVSTLRGSPRWQLPHLFVRRAALVECEGGQVRRWIQEKEKERRGIVKFSPPQLPSLVNHLPLSHQNRTSASSSPATPRSWRSR